MCIALHGNQSQSYGASPAIWDHATLSATGHSVALTPARQAGTRFTSQTHPEGWKAELTVAVGYSADSHPSKY